MLCSKIDDIERNVLYKPETKAHQKTGDYSKNKSFKPNSNSIEKRQKQDLKNLTLEN